MIIAVFFNKITSNFKTVYLQKWPFFVKNEYEQKDIKNEIYTK